MEWIVMSYALVFVLGVVVAASCGIVSRVLCEHCRKECSICWAKVEDYEDNGGDFYPAHHGDGWVEKITVPPVGKRPEVVLYLVSMDYEEEGVASFTYSSSTNHKFFLD